MEFLFSKPFVDYFTVQPEVLKATMINRYIPKNLEENVQDKELGIITKFAWRDRRKH
jgi:hypothetical protein